MYQQEVPSDIIEDILDWVEHDFTTLKSVSSSSRIMRHLAQKRLFKTVNLNCYSRSLPNLRLLARASVHNPLLATYVRHLKITISPRDFHNDDLINFMSQLTRVQSLHLLNNVMLFSDEWKSIPLQFRSALNRIIQSTEALRLENVLEMPLSNLSRCPNLKTLTLTDTTLSFSPETVIPLQNIDSLSATPPQIQTCTVQFSLSHSRSSQAVSTLNALATMDLSKMLSLKFITNRISNVKSLEKITSAARSLRSFRLQVLPTYSKVHLGYLLRNTSRAISPVLPTLTTLELSLCGIEDDLHSLGLFQSVLNPFRDYDMLQEFHLRLYLRDEDYDEFSLEDGLSDLRKLFRRTDLHWPSLNLASASVMNLDDGILQEENHKQPFKNQRSNVSFLSV